jgi:hypothetical protein
LPRPIGLAVAPAFAQAASIPRLPQPEAGREAGRREGRRKEPPIDGEKKDGEKKAGRRPEGRMSTSVCPQCAYNIVQAGPHVVCENCGYSYVE